MSTTPATTNAPRIVYVDEPTTSLTAEEVSLLVDEELLDFCEVHCWTPEARFTRDTVRRLFLMAGSKIQGTNLPPYITARPAIMNVLIDAARNGLNARRRTLAGFRPL